MVRGEPGARIEQVGAGDDIEPCRRMYEPGRGVVVKTTEDRVSRDSSTGITASAPGAPVLRS